MTANRRHTTDEAVAAAREMLAAGKSVADVQDAIVDGYDHICGWHWEQANALYFAQFGTVRATLPLSEAVQA